MADLKFDSKEEEYVFWWLHELFEEGYIIQIEMQPKSFELSKAINPEYYTPYKVKEGGRYTKEEILKKHIYTADFKIYWSKSAVGFITEDLLSNNKKKNGSKVKIISQMCPTSGIPYSYFEVKGTFDRNNMTRLAKVNIKWVWDKYGDYVNIIIPQKLFPETFTPEKYLLTDGKTKERTIKYDPVRTFQEFRAQISS